MSRNLSSLRSWGVIVSVVSLFVISGVKTVVAGPVADDNEIQVSGGLFHAQGSDSGSFNTDLSYGYYLSPDWQLGLRQSLNYTFIDDNRDVWNATTAPFVHYHFRWTDNVLPYLGASTGLVWNDRDVTGTFGPEVGSKFFFQDQTFFNVGYRYEWFFDEIETLDDNASDGNHVVNFGIGFVWGGAR